MSALLCSVCGRGPHAVDDPLCTPPTAGLVNHIIVLRRRAETAEAALAEAAKVQLRQADLLPALKALMPPDLAAMPECFAPEWHAAAAAIAKAEGQP